MSEGGSPGRGRLYLLVALMTWFWALNFIIAKIALREIPPLLAAGLRLQIVGLILLPVYWWRRRAALAERHDGREILYLILLGLAGVGGNQYFFLTGISRTSASHAAFIMSMTPILVLLLAAIAGQERITLRKVAGLAVAFSGVLALHVAPGRAQGVTALGDFLVLCGALVFALFTVFGKAVTRRHSSLTVNTYAYVGSGLATAPLTLWQVRGFPFERVSAGAWLSLLYMALFASLLCYMIFYYALQHLPASRLSAFSYLQPALASTLAVLLLGEQLTLPLLAGGSLVLAGVFLTERGR